MSAPQIPTINHPSELPADMRLLLQYLVASGPVHMCTIMDSVDVPHARNKTNRLIHMGLAEAVRPPGSRESVYSATPRGRRFALPVGEPTPPRTIAYAGQYTGTPWPAYRPGADAALRIASVGYRH